MNNKALNWKNYLIIASSFYPPGDKKLVNKAEEARKIFNNDNEFELIYRQVLLGQDKIQNASVVSNKGLEYFNKADYNKAALEFEKAILINPLEYSYFENAATSNYMQGNLNKALEQINKVIDEMNPLNGKSEYIKALIFIRLGDQIGACPLLEISVNNGFSQASSLLSQYCK